MGKSRKGKGIPIVEISNLHFFTMSKLTRIATSDMWGISVFTYVNQSAFSKIYMKNCEILSVILIYYSMFPNENGVDVNNIYGSFIGSYKRIGWRKGSINGWLSFGVIWMKLYYLKLNKTYIRYFNALFQVLYWKLSVYNICCSP